MRLYFKKLSPNAVTPSRANRGDAGFDLTAISVSNTYEAQYDGYTEYGTGLAVAIPEGYVGLIFPRSSISKTGQALANSVGVIDSGYRGEIKFRFRTLRYKNAYEVGDRIGQLVIVPIPEVTLLETDNLDATDRGIGGFGSSGT